MKRLLGYRQSCCRWQMAKATLSRIETIRTIKCGYILRKPPGVRGKIELIAGLFDRAAQLETRFNRQSTSSDQRNSDGAMGFLVPLFPDYDEVLARMGSFLTSPKH
ncbi:hypothetical protein AAD018_009500 [Aestuariibius insulae]|uniref:hypothetical protein n=1 Tax=Aestuariibius insulae TaxID=2058287 RepID=UPI00345ED057